MCVNGPPRRRVLPSLVPSVTRCCTSCHLSGHRVVMAVYCLHSRSPDSGCCMFCRQRRAVAAAHHSPHVPWDPAASSSAWMRFTSWMSQGLRHPPLTEPLFLATFRGGATFLSECLLSPLPESRSSLPAGHALPAPYLEATIVLPQGQTVTLDPDVRDILRQRPQSLLCRFACWTASGLLAVEPRACRSSSCPGRWRPASP